MYKSVSHNDSPHNKDIFTTDTAVEQSIMVFLNNASDAVFLVDCEDDTILAVSPLAEKFYGEIQKQRRFIEVLTEDACKLWIEIKKNIVHQTVINLFFRENKQLQYLHELEVVVQTVTIKNKQCFILILKDSLRRFVDKENAERHNKRMTILNALNNEIQNMGNDVKTIAEEVCRSVAREIGDGCLIATLDNNDILTVLGLAHSKEYIEHNYIPLLASLEFKGESSLLWSVAKSKEPVIMPYLSKDNSLLLLHPNLEYYFNNVGIDALVILPLVYAGTSLGVLAVSRDRGSIGFSDTDVLLFRDIANNYSLMLRNAQLLEEYRLAKEAAERANALKSEFLANISHEIRTPMNSVIGFAELLQESIQDERQQQFVRSILMSGQHLLVLINDILDVSKIEAGKLEIFKQPLDLRVLAEELYNMFYLKAKSKNIALHIVWEGNIPPYIETDTARLRQILLNLISNAIKFTDVGQVILTISSSFEPQEKSVDLRFTVQDTGCGMPSEVLPNIFQPFYQGKQRSIKNEGTGLGLYITQRLTAMLKGYLEVESIEHRGSSFSVYFPHVSVLQRGTQAQTVALPVVLSQHRILIVDDNSESRELLKQYLRDSRAAMWEAADGETALQLSLQVKPSIIFMDIMLQHMNGIEAARKIRMSAAHAHVIIAVTARPNTEITEEYTTFDAWITKPFSKDILMNTLRKTIPYDVLSKSETTFLLSKENLLADDFIIRLQTEFLPAWQLLFPLTDTEEIERFALKLYAVSEEYQSSLFLQYAANLAEQARFLDFENLPDMLQKFPALIAQYTQNLH